MRGSLARLLGGHGHARVSSSWLGRLPEGWHLHNDVAVGELGERIDHVIVGPAGVFAVCAKNVSGNVWVGASGVRVNGHATDFVQASLTEARLAARMLSAALERPIEVRPVLAILADGWTIQAPRTDVFIGAPRGVRDWLGRLPAVLTPGDVSAIATAAGQPSTWETD